jgi:PEP-CTERM motif
MKFAQKSLIAVAAFVALGAAQAETLTVNGTLTDTASTGTSWTLSGLNGNGTLNFSDQLISALNTAKVGLTQVSPATLVAPKDVNGNYLKAIDTNGDGRKEASVYAAAPVQALGGNFDGNVLTVSTVVTSGGAQQITVKNGATTGPGNLTISNLRVEIGDRAGFAGTIYADLSSTTAGFVNKTGYALWTFDELRGPTTFSVPNPEQQTVFNVNNSLHGLFLVNQTEGLDVFTQALALNTSIGRPALRGVDNRTSTTNIDPLTGKVAGFGWITSSISVTATPAVPEPSTYALMGLGLVGISLVARRKAK